MKLIKKREENKPADRARLDIHDFWGRLQDRIKASVNEKEKGVLMIELIKDRFSLTEKEILSLKEKLKKEEYDEALVMVKQMQRKERVVMR